MGEYALSEDGGVHIAGDAVETDLVVDNEECRVVLVDAFPGAPVAGWG